MGKRTVLYKVHSEMGHIVEFAGFDMPLFYVGISEEVMSVRNKAGVFDVSHMGRVLFSGKEAGTFLDFVTSQEISKLEPNQARYALILNENGGIKDDIIVVRRDDESYLVVWNAANRDKNIAWVEEHAKSFDVEIKNISDKSFMIALQGPYSETILQQICDRKLDVLKRFRGTEGYVKAAKCLITRTGYTGEDGFELISEDIEMAEDIWRNLISLGATPAGLGARDVLRIEAGLPLYGHEINEEINPFEAGLEFAVKLQKGDFIGKVALERLKDAIVRKRMGIKMTGKGIPREGYKVYSADKEIGFVTSGTYSPTINLGIAMAYLPVGVKLGEEVIVKIRGRDEKGVVSDFPFYDTEIYGWRRKK
ncbi:MAG: glycine cleavage system aminomethyltransferase GcvT [Candidatus Methanomethyliaceae archaeon]|nr:glycine cleavage system aminomethyltransferase GcvT [Candidatus Methanomethyliaceae archaeon]